MQVKTEIKTCPDCGGSGKCKNDEAILLYLFLKGSSAEMPVKSNAIEKRFDISSTKVKRLIFKLQEEGYRVIADRHGYFIAQNVDELLAYKNSILNRIEKLFRKLWAVDGLLECEATGKKPPEINTAKCQTCHGLGRIMTNRNIYDDLITVGSSNSSGGPVIDA